MLSTLLLMTLVLMVSIGNLALGFGLALHLGHGPAAGWQALMFWKARTAASTEHVHAPAAEVAAAAAPAPAAHGH